MPHILLVDDNPVDRTHAALLLGARADLTLSQAVDGRDALERLSDAPADLVVSDIQMPRMDGLELLDALHERHPGLPLVLVTAEGSEAVAAEALRKGAASYVPKCRMRDELADVCDRVLQARAEATLEESAEDALVALDARFRLPPDRRRAAALGRHLQRRAARLGRLEERDVTRLGVALEEALLNAVIHGNLEVSSASRERGDGTFERLIEARAADPAYRDRRVHVRLRFDGPELEFTIRDEGPGFDVAALPDPTDPANLVKASGRGLLLMRAFMDEVTHNAAGNQITLRERCAAPEPAAEPAPEKATGPAAVPAPHFAAPTVAPAVRPAAAAATVSA